MKGQEASHFTSSGRVSPRGSRRQTEVPHVLPIQSRPRARARQEYQAKLAHHNSELRSFCNQSGIHYSLYVNDRDLGDFVFATLPAIGLFK